MSVKENLGELIGNTPLLALRNIEKMLGTKANLYGKIESRNPAGSAKDRVALSILDAAERAGKLRPGGTVIEPTSGNTGIALAALCAARGYRAVIVMPDNMSRERILLMKAYGAAVVLTPGALGMSGAIAEAERIRETTPGSILGGQFENPENPAAHYRTTGPEIYADLGGRVDFFVAGVGTGGTISGTGKYLKEKNPRTVVVGVEPKTSAVLSGGEPGKHGLQGIGAGFIPKVLDTAVYDKIIPVSDEEAYAAGRLLARREGILAGITSGAALYAAMSVALQPVAKGKNIVVLLPDTGERYLSSPMFAEDAP